MGKKLTALVLGASLAFGSGESLAQSQYQTQRGRGVQTRQPVRQYYYCPSCRTYHAYTPQLQKQEETEKRQEGYKKEVALKSKDLPDYSHLEDVRKEKGIRKVDELPPAPSVDAPYRRFDKEKETLIKINEITEGFSNSITRLIEGLFGGRK